MRQASVTDYLHTQPPRSVDRYVLMDAQDWMYLRQLRALWYEIGRTAASGPASFSEPARGSPAEGVLPAAERARWHYDPARGAEWIERDRAAVYNGFHLYERTG